MLNRFFMIRSIRLQMKILDYIYQPCIVPYLEIAQTNIIQFLDHLDAKYNLYNSNCKIHFLFHHSKKKAGGESSLLFFPGAGNGSGLLYITNQWGFQVKVTIDKQDAPWMYSRGIAYAVMDEE